VQERRDRIRAFVIGVSLVLAVAISATSWIGGTHRRTDIAVLPNWEEPLSILSAYTPTPVQQ
jgi:hypothetical protein